MFPVYQHIGTFELGLENTIVWTDLAIVCSALKYKSAMPLWCENILSCILFHFIYSLHLCLR